MRNSGALAVVEGVGDHGCEYMTGGCVVVIGSIGRNFAAGMSGGVAYVLDESGDFEKRCNTQMVEIEKIKQEEETEFTDRNLDVAMIDMLSDDEARLHLLIERHMKFTNSSRAKAILHSWDDYLTKFVKVMPIDYRRALIDAQTIQKQDLMNLAAGE